MKNNFIKENTIIQYNNNASDYIETILKFDTGLELGLDDKSYAIFEENIKQNMDFQNGNLTITADNAKYKLKAQAYNPIELVKETKENVVVNYKSLNNALSFVDKSGRRPALSGVCIDSQSMTATDSYIMYNSTIEKINTLTKKYIINEEFVKNLLKYKQDEYKLEFNDNVCKCTIAGADDGIESITIVGSLIAGVYPPTERIFSQTLSSSVELDVKKILEQAKYNDFKSDSVAFKNDNGIIRCNTSGAVEVEFELGKIENELDILLNLEQFSKLKLIEADRIYYNPNQIGFVKAVKDNETIIIMQISR